MKRSRNDRTEWWNSERRLERLSELRSAGMTYEKIAVELGTTKSAVIGMATRLGTFEKRVTKSTSKSEPTAFSAYPPQPSARQCRWPLWVGHITHEYCLAPTALIEMPYCDVHAKRAYQPHRSLERIVKSVKLDKHG